MENLNDYLQEAIPYVKERASAEGRIIPYIKQKYGEKLSLDNFISIILQLHEDFWDLTDDMTGYSDVDERNYIAGKTDFADEMIELVLWFYECYLMKTDCSEYSGICPKCRGDKLYLREDEGYLFGCYIECGSCGEHLEFEDMYEFENSIIPMGSDKAAKHTKKSEITESSYIFKAATGYRKGIWRRIQISTGATLDDLAYAILFAFDFDLDHLYAFYMDEKGRTRNVPTYHSPNCTDEPKTDGVLLKELHLAAGTKFLFLYDFGREWNFTITFEKEVAVRTSYPEIVQYRGEAPEQYE